MPRTSANKTKTKSDWKKEECHQIPFGSEILSIDTTGNKTVTHWHTHHCPTATMLNQNCRNGRIKTYRQVMSSQWTIIANALVEIKIPNKHRDALKRASLFANVNDIKTNEWIECLTTDEETPSKIEQNLNLEPGTKPAHSKGRKIENHSYEWLWLACLRKLFNIVNSSSCLNHRAVV